MAAALKELQASARQHGVGRAPPAAGPAAEHPPPGSARLPKEAFLKRLRLGPGVRLMLVRFSRKLLELFAAMDEDGRGELTEGQFYKGLAAANIVMTESEFASFVRMLDKSGDGLIDYSELAEGLHALAEEHKAAAGGPVAISGRSLSHFTSQGGDQQHGVWPLRTRSPTRNLETRSSVAAPWQDNAPPEPGAPTATQISQRKWKQSQSSGAEDHRWPAPTPVRKSPKPYEIPRSCTPKLQPWTPSRPSSSRPSSRQRRTASRTPTRALAQPEPSPPKPKRGEEKLTLAEQAATARARREANAVAREEQAAQTARSQSEALRSAPSPYSRRPPDLRQLTASPRPRTASPRIKTPSRPSFSPHKPTTPPPVIGIYLPSACGSRSSARKKKRAKPPSASSTVNMALPRGTDSVRHKPVLEEALDRLCEGLISKRLARDAFRKMDKDSSGALDGRELTIALRHLNLELEDKHVTAVMEHLDADGDGGVSIQEFVGLVWERKLVLLRKKFTAAAYVKGGLDLKALFNQYDPDRSGALDFVEFRKAVRKTGGVAFTQQHVSDKELRSLFDHVDTDGGGTIGLAEFIALLQG